MDYGDSGYCLDSSHRERFEKMVLTDGTRCQDVERISFFFILSGNDDLYDNSGNIYDFREHMLGSPARCRELSTGASALLALAKNLYNGFHAGQSDPCHVFPCLDSASSMLAINAIRLRFRL